ncbi:MAG: MBL fold metallo-hydrolase, partial [Sulfolobales archaeon]
MRISFIAFESLGVRSMSTFIETRDALIHIDPGVSLAPRRYGLPPHEIELKRLDESSKEIYEMARDAEILIITHYHYDHH